MGTGIVVVMTFLAAFLGVFAGNSLLLELFPPRRHRVKQRMTAEFRSRQRAQRLESPLFKDLSQLAEEAFEEVEAERPDLSEQLRSLLLQSGLNLTPNRLLTIMGGSAVAIGGPVALFSQSVLMGMVGALIGFSVPLVYVQIVRYRRLEKLRSQLPDALELISRVLRAGQSVSQAIQAVGDEFPPPVGEEYGFCHEQQNLGLPADAALRDLARRSGILELKIFVLAVMVQRQTGGNLAQLLEKLAEVVRDRFRIRGLIKSLTAEGRLQAAILLSLPMIMLVVLLILNSNYMMALFSYPMLLVGVLISEAMGALWIRKIINFDF